MPASGLTELGHRRGRAGVKGEPSQAGTVRKASQRVDSVSDPGLGPARVGGMPGGGGDARQGARHPEKEVVAGDGAGAQAGTRGDTVFQGEGLPGCRGQAPSPPRP